MVAQLPIRPRNSLRLARVTFAKLVLVPTVSEGEKEKSDCTDKLHVARLINRLSLVVSRRRLLRFIGSFARVPHFALFSSRRGRDEQGERKRDALNEARHG